MAKISAHGSIIGTVEYLTTAKRYMSDGVVLKNIGFGWKLHGRCKAEVTPAVAYANAATRLTDKLADRPAHAAYRKALHEMAGMDKRWKLHAAVSMMPEDPDGVWSEACDGYGDIDDVVELCLLYRVIELSPGA